MLVTQGCCTFATRPHLSRYGSFGAFVAQGGVINLATAYAKCGMTQCPMASDTGHEVRSFTYEASDELMMRPAKDTCLSGYDLRGIHEPTLPIHEHCGDEAVTSGDMLGGLEFAAFPGPPKTSEFGGSASLTQKTDSSDSTVLSAFAPKTEPDGAVVTSSAG